MLRFFWALLCYFLVCSICTAKVMAEPMKDGIFDQYVSSKFTYPSTPVSKAWPNLPFDEKIQQLYTAAFVNKSNHVVFILTEKDLLLWTGTWESQAGIQNIVVETGSRLTYGVYSGMEGVFINGPNSGIYFYSCNWSSPSPSLSTCKASLIIPLTLGPVNSIEYIDDENPSIAVAPQRGGLILISTSATSLSVEPACNPWENLVNGDYRGLKLYSENLCAQLRHDNIAAKCLIPGTYSKNCTSFASQPVTEPLSSIAYKKDFVSSTFGMLVVGGNETLQLRNGKRNNEWRSIFVGDGVDGAVNDIKFSDNNFLWVATNDSISYTTSNISFNRVGVYQGLSVHNATNLAFYQTPIAAASNELYVWAGSMNGISAGAFLRASNYPLSYYESLQQTQNASPVIGANDVKYSHRYLTGSRWLASNPSGSTADEVDGSSAQALNETANLIRGLASFDGQGWSKGLKGPYGGVWALTQQGLSLIESVPMTIRQKVDYFQTIADVKMDRFGLASDCDLSTYGDTNTCTLHDDDNDGLWTSIYAGALSFKYAVTQNEQDRLRAWRRFEGLEFLHNVTSIKGMVARSLLKQDTIPNYGTWYKSIDYPGFVWKGDTSSDEISGHFFAIPLIYKLVAKSDSEKARAKNAMCNLLDYIVDNGFNLKDADGQYTTWGRWSPLDLNRNRFYYDERGTNSVQILAWLQIGIQSCDDQEKGGKYSNALKYLINEHQYDVNLINLKVEDPFDDNFSDDELTFLPYYSWLEATEYNPSSSMGGDSLLKSINRTISFIAKGRPSLWQIIATVAGVHGSTFDEVDPNIKQDFVFNLRRSAMDTVDWPVQNSIRNDVIAQWHSDRFGTNSMGLLPFAWDENIFSKWNANPFQMDGGSGMTEFNPGVYLLPYWMMVYHAYMN